MASEERSQCPEWRHDWIERLERLNKEFWHSFGRFLMFGDSWEILCLGTMVFGVPTDWMG